MIARFAGVCCCGCRRPYRAGDEIVGRPGAWARAECRATAPSAGPFASRAEVLEVFAHARAVAQREERAAVVRRAGRAVA
jgi:hypothetical protein